MIVDHLIIGQGICGTWLAHYLLKKDQKIFVIDNCNKNAASHVASGLINPVTGRRVVTTWMADELLPFDLKEYDNLSIGCDNIFIRQKNILVFPSAPDLQNAFLERMKEQNGYIKQPVIGDDILRRDFNFPFGVFCIDPCYVVEVQTLLSCYRQYLRGENVIEENIFDEKNLIITKDGVEYENIKARNIIYANGIQASNSKYWMNLPFVQNKGQALIVEIQGLDKSYVYKFGHITLIPLKNDDWWVGSSNELSFKTIEPTEDFKTRTSSTLSSVLKKDFTIKEHWSALRPATVERRPFVGVHPIHKQISILNGMGSKGISLAPWFAQQLAENLTKSIPIDPLADVRRYSKVLSKQENIMDSEKN